MSSEIKVEEIPVVICNRNRVVMRNPTVQKLADCLGLNVSIDLEQVRDLIIVGAGPSGLAAAVYAASEGLDVAGDRDALPEGRQPPARRSRTIWAFPPASGGRN